MNSNISMKKILSLLIAAFILVLAGRAGGEDLSVRFNLNKTFSGTSPVNGIPWLIAVFENNDANDKDPKKVLLTMSASNLKGPEYVRMWFFNFTQNSGNLTFSHVSGPQAIYIRKNSDCCRASGTGNHDFQFIFRDNEFDSGKASVYEISYISPITSLNFSEQSIRPGGSKGGYGSAALVTNINGDDKLFGWIGDDGKGAAIKSES